MSTLSVVFVGLLRQGRLVDLVQAVGAGPVPPPDELAEDHGVGEAVWIIARVTTGPWLLGVVSFMRWAGPSNLPPLCRQ